MLLVICLYATFMRVGEWERYGLIYLRAYNLDNIVASKGGAAEHPEWYRNLSANPDVDVQVLGDRFEATARTATEQERPALWQMMAEIWPAYNNYQTKTDRDIPVVILERKGS